MKHWKKITFQMICFLSVTWILGCYPTGSEIHLLPEGYVGAVVLVWDELNGQPLAQNHEGAFIYEIPSDGVLRVSASRPDPNIHKIQWFYKRPNGEKVKIPSSRDESTLQVFADVLANRTDFTSGGKTVTYMAYVVGVPKDRHDWVRLRKKVTDQAIGRKRLRDSVSQ